MNEKMIFLLILGADYKAADGYRTKSVAYYLDQKGYINCKYILANVIWMIVL